MEHLDKDSGWRTYESVFSQRIKTAIAKLSPLIGKAGAIMHIVKRASPFTIT
jgi:hypothetical protein